MGLNSHLNKYNPGEWEQYPGYCVISIGVGGIIIAQKNKFYDFVTIHLWSKLALYASFLRRS